MPNFDSNVTEEAKLVHPVVPKDPTTIDSIQDRTTSSPEWTPNIPTTIGRKEGKGISPTTNNGRFQSPTIKTPLVDGSQVALLNHPVVIAKSSAPSSRKDEAWPGEHLRLKGSTMWILSLYAPKGCELNTIKPTLLNQPLQPEGQSCPRWNQPKWKKRLRTRTTLAPDGRPTTYPDGNQERWGHLTQMEGVKFKRLRTILPQMEGVKFGISTRGNYWLMCSRECRNNNKEKPPKKDEIDTRVSNN